MASNDLILQWLDGSLGSDAEAELLHLLSVSPERRDILHSYMQQKKLVDRDMAAITVPFAAEEALWQRIGATMPAPIMATEVAAIAPAVAVIPAYIPEASAVASA